MPTFMSPSGTNVLERVGAEATNFITRERSGHLLYGSGLPADRAEAAYHAEQLGRERDAGAPTFRSLLLEAVYSTLGTSDTRLLREFLYDVAAVAVAWITVIDARERVSEAVGQ